MAWVERGLRSQMSGFESQLGPLLGLEALLSDLAFLCFSPHL